jgi:hypothetical protein
MELKLILGISAGLSIFCYLPYIRDIFLKKTQPHAYSWLVWTLLQVTGTLAGFKDGGGYGTWAIGVGSLFCFLIFLLSFKYGTKNISSFDFLCLLACLVAILFYIKLDNPLWSVLVVTIIDFIGFLPTYRKGWEEPETETVSTYLIAATSYLLALFALQNYTVITLLYVVSLLITNSTFAALVLMKRAKISYT